MKAGPLHWTEVAALSTLTLMLTRTLTLTLSRTLTLTLTRTLTLPLILTRTLSLTRTRTLTLTRTLSLTVTLTRTLALNFTHCMAHRQGMPAEPQPTPRPPPGSRQAEVAGTLLTARLALERGLAVNTAGGTHHAFPDRGSGFCILHDMAVASRLLLEEGAVRRVLIVDLDVHQGAPGVLRHCLPD
jgi:hypothetical protein